MKIIHQKIFSFCVMWVKPRNERHKWHYWNVLLLFFFLFVDSVDGKFSAKCLWKVIAHSKNTKWKELNRDNSNSAIPIFFNLIAQTYRIEKNYDGFSISIGFWFLFTSISNRNTSNYLHSLFNTNSKLKNQQHQHRFHGDVDGWLIFSFFFHCFRSDEMKKMNENEQKKKTKTWLDEEEKNGKMCRLTKKQQDHGAHKIYLRTKRINDYVKVDRI